MHIWPHTLHQMPKTRLSCCFLLFDGFSNMVLASALEPLKAAVDLPLATDVSWSIATLNDGPVRSSSGLIISPDTDLCNIPNLDYLFVVCGYGVREHAEHCDLHAWRSLSKKARVIGGLDTGAWFLAATNMLNGHKSTIHWQEQDAFQDKFPALIHTPSRFVISSNRVTCGGASTAMDLLLSILSETFGRHVAFDVSNFFVYDVERQYLSERGAIRPRNRDSEQLKKAASAMMMNIETPMKQKDIASASAMSVRSLNRLFYKELGMSPGKYYLHIRLGRARDLAQETTIPVSEIAIATGFSSLSTLGRAFQQCFGKTVSEIRRVREGQHK